MDTVTLAEMPLPVRIAVSRRTGLILSMNRVDAGHNSPLSVRLDTPTGPLFVKGLPDTSPGRVATQRREYEIGRHLGGLAPRARWEIRAGGWYLVAFDHLDGARQADYRPGSPDLPAVAALLRSVAQHRVPGAVELRRAEQRLAAYGTREQLRHVVGGTLLHTDLNPENVLIAGGGTPRLVDWGWATVGAPWLDAAAWAVWLVAYGHTPEAAHGWAGRVPAYQRAAPAALRAYAVMASAMWEDVAAASTAPWTGTVLSAARSLASWHDRSPSRGR